MTYGTSDLGTRRDGGVVAVILAAGRGTRMGSLTETSPKPLLPVLNKPAVEWVIDGALAAGIRRIVVVTGYLSDMVREALADYRKDEVSIEFVLQEAQKGTAHALKLTEEAVGGADVLLAFADIMTSPENFEAMIRRFYDEQCALTAAVRDAGDPWRAAAVYVNDSGDIQRIIEKPAVGTSTTPWSHAGMYCFTNEIFRYLDQVTPSTRGEYEVTDAVQMMIAGGLRCRIVELAGYWKDLATPEDIAQAEEMMGRA